MEVLGICEIGERHVLARPTPHAPRPTSPVPRSSHGFTLIEILIATTLSLLLMGAVVAMFARISQSITASRAMLESADRLRTAAARLQQDLGGVTVDMSKVWHKPEDNEGYLEYIEGPVTQATASNFARDMLNIVNDALPDADPNRYAVDTTVGDFDDILMFTTRSSSKPFVGKYGSTTAQSDVAEVAWFIRGKTLYRRVLLVLPSMLQQKDANTNGYLDHDGSSASTELGLAANTSFFGSYDVSVRAMYNGGVLLGYVPNTLGDLTKRENRFAHQTGSFPYNAQSLTEWPTLRLPTLCECSSPKWIAGAVLPTHGAVGAFTLTASGVFDAWQNPLPWKELDKATGAHSHFYTPGALATNQRIADDVILTNVVGFDVKAWDANAPVYFNNATKVYIRPGDPTYPTYFSGGTTPVSYGAYVELGYGNVSYSPANAKKLAHFGAAGCENNGLVGTTTTARVYDTWPNHYEYEGTATGDTLANQGFNGLDDGGTSGIVDDISERLTSPPYPVPLRGIQVKIRVFEPDSRDVREVTVVQDFLQQ